MRTLIENGNIVNEGKCFKANILIEDDKIFTITNKSIRKNSTYDHYIDAKGSFILPGIIDTHVHFREPGLEEKADIDSESRAAAYGGVTSFFDMPNTIPQTITIKALQDKYNRAKLKSHINYTFFFGATSNNSDTIKQLDIHSVPGVKLFMGASTGNMLVDERSALDNIFESVANKGLILMTHCEDSAMINKNMIDAKKIHGADPNIIYHDIIRSEAACYKSSSLAVELSLKHKTQLHIAHITTARELSLLNKPNVRDFVTLEAVIAHLIFTNKDYKTIGSLIKCNPAVKSITDRTELRKALADGRISTIGTDHAPHLISQKQGGCSCAASGMPTIGSLIKCNPAVKSITDRTELRKALADGRISTIGTDHAPHLISQKQGGCSCAASGMPIIQFSLVCMLELVDKGVITLEQLVNLMAHTPSKRFNIDNRGYLREGYKADIVIVTPNKQWTVTKDIIQSKCKWSPLIGHIFNWKVEHTFCNGIHLYNNGVFNENYRGEKLSFRSNIR